MIKALRKLFGGIDLSWPKLITAAVLAGAFTAAMALIPAVQNTSLIAITTSYEAWILFGIIIIMNSRSNLDAALKCFVFFLISQPLVYLIQIPFSPLGWGLFEYYRNWILLTILCFPMGFVGHYMKKDKWWGYLILLPMIALTAYCYWFYFPFFLFSGPRYLLVTLFCAAAMILYPVGIFDNKKIWAIGAGIGIAALVCITGYFLLHPPVYNPEILTNGDEYRFDDSYSAYLADERLGDVEIKYISGLEDYAVHAEFQHAGKTVLTIESPTGEKTEFDISVERYTYTVTERIQ